MRDFLAALASAEAPSSAVPASALAAGMGVSLLLMVAALPRTRSESADDRTALTIATTELGDVQRQLIETIDTETAVKIFAARNLPHASVSQRAEREAAIQLALQAAADIPLEIMRLAALGLTHARTVAAWSRRAAAGDVELAVGLLRIALSGARSSLEMKLTSLTDVVYTKAVVDEIVRLNEEATQAARAAELLVQAPPA